MPAFPTLTATKVQAASYLVGVALFSISFLVFLNASISFVVTDVIGQRNKVGNVVGTLGFADELVALVACPLWGMVSDKIGVRNVAVTGYCIVGLSLILLVQSGNVYPQLLVARMAFSVGGAACSTMVTAILPCMTAERKSGTRPSVTANEAEAAANPHTRHSGAFSVSSELTITPARFVSRPPTHLRRRSQKLRFATTSTTSESASKSDPSQLAGYVGMFTGLGALIAVAVFLPLPVKFSARGVAQADAVKDSFYLVGSISLVVAILVSVTLRGLPGEQDKGFHRLFYSGRSTPLDHQDDDNNETTSLPCAPTPSYYNLVRSALSLGMTDSRIFLGYLGGFVARASSVGISLFIPLFINAYFIRQGLCSDDDPSDELKKHCKRAYTLASMLSGFSQLTALVCAPLFGWLNGYMSRRERFAFAPLGVGALAGGVGCVIFGNLDNPDPFHGHGGKAAILAVVLLGVGQISAIVCSLGLLARGIQDSALTFADAIPTTTTLATEDTATPTTPTTAVRETVPEEESSLSSTRLDPTAAAAATTTTSTTETETETETETSPLLPKSQPPQQQNSSSSSPTSPPSHPNQNPKNKINPQHLKGTIAGIYSLAGGMAILLLTKLGGVLFDEVSVGAPFYLLAGFNGVLVFGIVFVVGVCGVGKGGG
jgi:MFS family permease